MEYLGEDTLVLNVPAGHLEARVTLLYQIHRFPTESL
jgi:hypothetical protein